MKASETFTLSYYDGEEEDRPILSINETYETIEECKNKCDELKIPYSVVRVSEWGGEVDYLGVYEYLGSMSLDEALYRNLTVTLNMFE